MNITPELVYATVILPCLFALTLIGDGISKIMRNKSGFVSILTGSIFLIIVVVGYFMITRQ